MTEEPHEAIAAVEQTITLICPFRLVGGFMTSDVLDDWHNCRELADGSWFYAIGKYSHPPKWVKWRFGVTTSEGDLKNWSLDSSCFPYGHKYEKEGVGRLHPTSPVMYGWFSDYFRTTSLDPNIALTIQGKTVYCAYTGFDTSQHR